VAVVGADEVWAGALVKISLPVLAISWLKRTQR